MFKKQAANGWGKRAAHNRAQICYYIAENLMARFDEIAHRIDAQTGSFINFICLLPSLLFERKNKRVIVNPKLHFLTCFLFQNPARFHFFIYFFGVVVVVRKYSILKFHLA